jgi:hypothetical protein
MTANIVIDDREFQRALRAYYPTTRRTLAQIVNQRAYNIAGRTMDMMKPAPGREQSTRRHIRAYMNSTVSTRVRVVKSGPNKGKYKRAGAKGNQLARVNLIIQMRRAKRGLKGLYGAAMRQAEGKFKQAAQVGVGFLKSPFVAVVRDLGMSVKFKPRIRTSWGRIAIWPGSRGRGTVNPAQDGMNPTVIMKMLWNVRGHPGRVESLIVPHLQRAFNDEAREIMRHVQEKMQKDADRINARR